jgi:glutamate-5-semialdehyde dehydrogenase
MNLKKEVRNIGEAAKEASGALSSLKPGIKKAALKEMKKSLILSRPYIMKENAKDLKKAKKRKVKASFVDRLRLTDKRIEAMASSVGEIIKLEDPAGAIEKLIKRPNGLLIGRMRVPIGVIFVIYESRPNVTADCMALALKSGNSLILRGGSEAINSNIAIFNVLQKAALKAGVPKNSFNMIKTTDRTAVDAMLGLEGIIDVVIPRGGESLIREVAKKSSIPVIKHYQGVCHVYVDDYADLNMAESVSFNAKVQRPGVCNAMETLLVHTDVAARFLPSMAKKFIEAGVEIRGCPMTKKILKRLSVKPARESDWQTEYLDLIVSVKVVNSLEEAIIHINKYGTSHSDAIITENHKHAMRFLRDVDSSSVYVNASTRFTDGYEFGKGAEMGISTDKLHARGPVGVEELTTYKYVIFGNGQIRK